LSAHKSTSDKPGVAPERSSRWTWELCSVLLAATLLNYATRFVFTQNAVPVKEALGIGDAGYGEVNSYFALGFAFGALLFGALADRISVRWLYPFLLLAWSAANVGCALVDSLGALNLCCFLVALFEAGHWPCALRTTQRNFKPAQRTWANSVLQSGASVGAILAPQLVAWVYRYDPAQWRWSFFIVGALSLPWIAVWLLIVRESDVTRPVIQTDETSSGVGRECELEETPFFEIFRMRRWWLLLLIVSCINVIWHFIRVWMPVWLEEDHGYSHEFVQHFTSVYYAVTFLGALASGWLTAYLPRRGWNVHRARLATFLLFAALASLAIPAAYLPKGFLLLATLLLVAFGSLGLFPIYYSLNQEISARHQGKVGGSLGFSTWALLYFFHKWVGQLTEADPSTRPYVFTVAGCGPLLGFLLLAAFWGRRESRASERE